ncbi:MAG: hypothetical protein R3245_12350, partial [Kiloniellales bacterium]|nr:hypothetical protein [Kiloniellales bacterium]
TSRATDDPEGGVRLLRTLDWPFHGLGRNLVVARHDTSLGPFYNVTWPGFLGVITAVAPGRFAVAINQAPILKTGPSWLPYPWAVDWLIGRFRVFMHKRIVPAFLLRRVFETCRSYQEARKTLESTSVALPVFYVLSGLKPGEHSVIERLPERAEIYETAAVVANEWLSADLAGRVRGRSNRERCSALQNYALTAGVDGQSEPFDWLSPPVLNPNTRLVLSTNAAGGALFVQGYEKDGPVTKVRRIAFT